MPSLTNAVLAQQVSDLVGRWRNRELEFQAWLAGAADGGDYGDGRFPLTDYLGVVRYTYSPAALESSVGVSASSASTSATEAAASAANASASEGAAEDARDAAGTARDAAITARDLADLYADNSAASAANALSYKNDAAASAGSASGSATNADASATAAADSATAADSSADSAAASAAAAAASAAAAATFDPDNFYTKTAADARYRQLSVEITSGDITSLDWSKLTSVPSTFTPASHSHGDSDLTSLAWSKLTGVPSTFAPDQSDTYVWTGSATFTYPALRLRATEDGVTDANYISWLNDDGSVERAWAGFGGNNTTTFGIYNNTGEVNVRGTSVRLDRAGGGSLHHTNFGSGSSKEWRIGGSDNNAYFFNGANEDLVLRPGKNTGAVYVGPNDRLSVGDSQVSVTNVTTVMNSGAALGLRIRTTDGNPWAIDLYREDYAASSRVFAHKYDGSNNGWAFEQMPYLPGIRDLGGGNANLQTPNTTGDSYRWDLYSNSGSAVSLRLLRVDGTGGVFLYENSGDFGLLDGAGNWCYRITTSTGAHRFLSSSGYHANVLTDSTWVNMTTNSSRWFMDKPLHVNGETYYYEKGAHLYYDESSNATGKITVSTSAASGTPADGELWFQREA